MKKTTRYFIVKVHNNLSKRANMSLLRILPYDMKGRRYVLNFDVSNIVKAVQYLQKKKDPAWKWVRAIFKECSG